MQNIDIKSDFNKSINLSVLSRILDVLHTGGPMKITNLAMYSGLNFTSCKKYSNLLNTLSWIEIKQSKNTQLFSITTDGKDILKKLELFAN